MLLLWAFQFQSLADIDQFVLELRALLGTCNETNIAAAQKFILTHPARIFDDQSLDGFQVFAGSENGTFLEQLMFEGGRFSFYCPIGQNYQTEDERRGLRSLLDFLPMFALRTVTSSRWSEMKRLCEDYLELRGAIGPSAGPNEIIFSDDFRSVRWHGNIYSFTANQAACVRLLLDHYQRGTPDVGDESLLAAADVSTERLLVVFRDHSAWGTMIIPGGTRGTHRIADAPSHDGAVPR